MKFLNELKRRLTQFMRGRYGHDELNTLILILYLIVILITYFVNHQRIASASSLLAFFLVAVLLFRTYSRNYHARKKENDIFLKYRNKLTNLFNRQPQTHVIFKCPNCKQKVRVPKGRKKIEITCPKCNHKFTKRT